MLQQSLFNDLNYDVSVILAPTNNDTAILQHCINALLGQAGLHEIVLLCTSNQNSELKQQIGDLARQHHSIQILNTDYKSQQLAMIYNMAAKHASSDYLLFLSAQCILSKDTFIRCIDALFHHTDGFLVTGLLTKPQSGKAWPNYYKEANIKTMLRQCFGFSRKRTIIPLKKKPTAETIKRIDPSFIFIRKDKLYQAGGFDEQYGHVAFCDALAMHVYELGYKSLLLHDLAIACYQKPGVTTSQTGIADIRRYLKNHYSGAYFPGSIATFCGFLAIRNLLYHTLKSPLMLKQRLDLQKELVTLIHFLDDYRKFCQTGKQKQRKANQPFDWSCYNPIIISHATSPIGLSLVRRLLAADMDVIALYHDIPPHFQHPKLRWHYTPQYSLAKELADYYPKTLIHCGDFAELEHYLEPAKAMGICRVIAYPHGQHSFEADCVRMCRTLELDFTLLRTHLTYGLGNHNSVHKVLTHIKRFGFAPIPKQHKQLCYPIHVDDVAISTLLALGSKSTFGKTFDLVTNEPLSYKEMIGRIFDHLGKKRRFITLGWLPHKSINLSQEALFGDITPAFETLGYTPRIFLEDFEVK